MMGKRCLASVSHKFVLMQLREEASMYVGSNLWCLFEMSISML